jgi:predicted metal-dependent phosphoesterase TrpH
MMKIFKAELHLHTCLSPCGSLDMTPRKIVMEACKKGLDIIAVTDHNTAENIQAVTRAAEGYNIRVIPGIEITTAEEVHVVGLFENIENALACQGLIYESLISGENDEDRFGIQVVANENDEVEGINKRLLIGATTLTVDEVVDAVHRLGGLAIAAHIDRESFGIIGQLGFIPEGLDFDALEISPRSSISEAGKQFPEYSRFTFTTASDAHYPEDIGRSLVHLKMAGPEFCELRMALAGIDGRDVLAGDEVI